MRGSRFAAVAEFCSVTNGTPEQAKFYLEASNGHVERAVSMFFGEDSTVLFSLLERFGCFRLA